MKASLRLTLLIVAQALVLILVLTCLLWAQPGLPEAPNQAPIGGTGLLAAAGAAFAWKKLRRKGRIG